MLAALFVVGLMPVTALFLDARTGAADLLVPAEKLFHFGETRLCFLLRFSSLARRGNTSASGEAIFVDLGGGKNLVALLAHIDKSVDLDAINYVAMRSYTAAGGKRVNFTDMSKMTGVAPVKGALIPVLVTFADPANPGTARNVPPDDSEAVLGKGYRLRGVSAEAVPNGFWPIDFGGPLGEPVTRGNLAKLPWLNQPDASVAAETALRTAGVPDVGTFDARGAFSRK